MERECPCACISLQEYSSHSLSLNNVLQNACFLPQNRQVGYFPRQSCTGSSSPRLSGTNGGVGACNSLAVLLLGSVLEAAVVGLVPSYVTRLEDGCACTFAAGLDGLGDSCWLSGRLLPLPAALIRCCRCALAKPLFNIHHAISYQTNC